MVKLGKVQIQARQIAGDMGLQGGLLVLDPLCSPLQVSTLSSHLLLCYLLGPPAVSFKAV